MAQGWAQKMHPEVYYSDVSRSIGLLFLLNWGTTSRESLKGSTLKQGSKSRRYVRLSLETNERISDHIGSHKRPSGEEWGDYLAGLIDGNSNIEKVSLSLRLKDKSWGYYIKKEIGYGSVEDDSISIRNGEGIGKVFNQINGKIRSEGKLNKIIRTSERYSIENIKLKIDKDLGNYWLAGMIDSRGTISKEGLKFEGSKMEEEVSELIREYTGVRRKLINYLDKYHLQSRKYVNYIKLRKWYRLEGLTKR